MYFSRNTNSLEIKENETNTYIIKIITKSPIIELLISKIPIEPVLLFHNQAREQTIAKGQQIYYRIYSNRNLLIFISINKGKGNLLIKKNYNTTIVLDTNFEHSSSPYYTI
jgi:hypothetical protein